MATTVDLCVQSSDRAGRYPENQVSIKLYGSTIFAQFCFPVEQSLVFHKHGNWTSSKNNANYRDINNLFFSITE